MVSLEESTCACNQRILDEIERCSCTLGRPFTQECGSYIEVLGPTLPTSATYCLLHTLLLFSLKGKYLYKIQRKVAYVDSHSHSYTRVSMLGSKVTLGESFLPFHLVSGNVLFLLLNILQDSWPGSFPASLLSSCLCLPSLCKEFGIVNVYHHCIHLFFNWVWATQLRFSGLHRKGFHALSHP